MLADFGLRSRPLGLAVDPRAQACSAMRLFPPPSSLRDLCVQAALVLFYVRNLLYTHAISQE